MMTTSVVMAAALGTASAVLKFKADLDADSVAYGCKGGNSIAFFWNKKCPENWNGNWNKITF